MPEELKALYSRGKELFDRGLYGEAELLLKKVVMENPNYADVHNKLGVICELRGEKKEAKEHFERALRLNPNYTEAAMNLAITLSDMGEPERAQEVLVGIREAHRSQSGALDPFVAGKLANEHFRLGNIYYDFMFLDEAIEQYQRAVSMRPGLIDIRTKLGVALRERGRHDEAMEQFVIVREENPGYAPARVQLGLSYYAKGMKDLALQEWESALSLDPSLKDAKTFLHLVKKEG